jgi:cobalamin biosynthesis protein CobD/CbiB
MAQLALQAEFRQRKDVRRAVEQIQDAARAGDLDEARRLVLLLYRRGAFACSLDSVYLALGRMRGELS